MQRMIKTTLARSSAFKPIKAAIIINRTRAATILLNLESRYAAATAIARQSANPSQDRSTFTTATAGMPCWLTMAGMVVLFGRSVANPDALSLRVLIGRAVRLTASHSAGV